MDRDVTTEHRNYPMKGFLLAEPTDDIIEEMLDEPQCMLDPDLFRPDFLRRAPYGSAGGALS